MAANSAMEGAFPAAKQNINGPSHDWERGHSTRMLARRLEKQRGRGPARGIAGWEKAGGGSGGKGVGWIDNGDG